MCKLFITFWTDERGSIEVGDWVFVTTILVLGAVTGLATIRHLRLDDLVRAVKPMPAKTVNHMSDSR